MLTGKTVLLGVSGSIAAYKTASLASALKKLHADVHVLMTKNAVNLKIKGDLEILDALATFISAMDEANVDLLMSLIKDVNSRNSFIRLGLIQPDGSGSASYTHLFYLKQRSQRISAVDYNAGNFYVAGFKKYLFISFSQCSA